MSEKILLIRFSSLGDCILLCPLAQRLKDAGAAEVAVLTKPAYAALFDAATGVDRVVSYDPRSGLRGLLRVAASLRGRGYRVLDAHNNPRSRIVSARLGGAAARFEKHYARRFGLIVFKRPAELPTILENYARLARIPASGTPALSPGGIDVGEASRERAAEILGNARRPVAIAPGSRWPAKRWPLERFAELSRRIAGRDGRPVVLVGDEADRAACEGARFDPACIDAMGRLDVTETGAVLERCSTLVGNDSGLVHLAEAVGTPAVVLYGPTVEAFGYYPSLARSRSIERRLACRPCSRNGSTPCPRGTGECLSAIGVDVVHRALAAAETGAGEPRIVVDAAAKRLRGRAPAC